MRKLGKKQAIDEGGWGSNARLRMIAIPPCSSLDEATNLTISRFEAKAFQIRMCSLWDTRYLRTGICCDHNLASADEARVNNNIRWRTFVDPVCFFDHHTFTVMKEIKASKCLQFPDI